MTESIKKPISMLKAYSVMTAVTITTTATAYDTYGGRKFSDYDLLIFYCGTSATDIRATLCLHKSDWTSSSNQFHMNSAHGASLESVSGVDATYNSDTKINLRASGSAAYTKVWCLGFKLE